MAIFSTILMLVFFPLNSFLLLQNGVFGDSQAQAKTEETEGSLQQGSVEGAETQKVELAVAPKKTEIFTSQYQSMRKIGAVDLTLPGAHASVVIDADSGTILHYDKGREQRQIASLTKLMTATLVMEKIKNSDKFEEYMKTSYQSPINFSLFKAIKLNFKKTFCRKLSYKERLFLKGAEYYENEMDIVEILKKLQEIEKLKIILFIDKQITL